MRKVFDKIRDPMQPWILLVTGSNYLNVTQAEVTQHWSLRELVDHIYYIEGVALQERERQKKQSKSLKRMRRRR